MPNHNTQEDTSLTGTECTTPVAKEAEQHLLTAGDKQTCES